jgi:uncharacterized protein YqgC (DUF456 family)
VLVTAAIVTVAANGTPCQPGAVLAFDCGPVRDLVVALIPLAAVLYVALLTAVVWWASRLAHRLNADPHGGRDWYVVAALVGLVIAPLLAFTILAGLGWLG